MDFGSPFKQFRNGVKKDVKRIIKEKRLVLKANEQLVYTSKAGIARTMTYNEWAIEWWNTFVKNTPDIGGMRDKALMQAGANALVVKDVLVEEFKVRI